MTFFIKGMGILLSVAIMTSCTSLTKKNEVETKNTEPDTPKLTKPIVKRIWVKDSINDEGTEYTTGHWKYILESKSVWSK